MKPGIYLPIFRPSDSLQAERIDEHLKMMTELINGGLTGQSLSQTSQLAATMFAENRSPFIINSGFNSIASGGKPIVGVINQASRILGVSATASVATVGASTTSTDRICTIYTGTGGSPTARISFLIPGSTAKNINITSTTGTVTTVTTFSYSSGYIIVDENTDLSVGTLVSFNMSLVGSETSVLASCSLVMTAGHSA